MSAAELKQLLRRSRNETNVYRRDVGMTQPNEQTDGRAVKDDGSRLCAPTAAEALAWRGDNVLLPGAEATPEQFPRLDNISAGFLVRGSSVRCDRRSA
jgi:hypothetical protein